MFFRTRKASGKKWKDLAGPRKSSGLQQVTQATAERRMGPLSKSVCLSLPQLSSPGLAIRGTAMSGCDVCEMSKWRNPILATVGTPVVSEAESLVKGGLCLHYAPLIKESKMVLNRRVFPLVPTSAKLLDLSSTPSHPTPMYNKCLVTPLYYSEGNA